MAESASPLNFLDIVEGRAPPPPSSLLLGWRFISLDRANGTLSCSFEATGSFLNPAGVIQGGFLAAMLDETMALAAAAICGGDIFVQTLEMKVSYLRAGRIGTIFGTGGIVQRGPDILFLEGRLFDAEARPIATATATSRALKARK